MKKVSNLLDTQMKFNNTTLMVRSDEREGGPRGTTLLRIKKGEEKLRLLISEETDLHSFFPFFKDKKLTIVVSMGKLLEKGDIDWCNAVKLTYTVPAKNLKLIFGEYHYISSGLIKNVDILYKGEGEYVLRGDHEIEGEKRVTWDYFKIVEEE